jgi:carboxypeptidase Q
MRRLQVEDAQMMARMQARGQPVVVNLQMGARTLPDRVSRNTIAEIKGWKYPEQVVLVSGHMDSWDVGQGAMDDGAGALISWQALSAISHLGLRPKRTLRVVMWTCEEFGGFGGQQYFADHKDMASNMSIVMESDLGTFTPLGIEFTGSSAATAVMQEVVQLLAPINTSYVFPNGDGTDISPWVEAGVPGASLHNQNDKYFYFHHSHGDTMTVQDPAAMDLCAATWAVTAYAIANLEDLLPR